MTVEKVARLRVVRRVVGVASVGGALLAALVAVVFSVQALVFQISTAEAVGEVVAVEPAHTEVGDIQEGRHHVVVEFPDRNGQFRRFDELLSWPVPVKGAQIDVRYRMGPPVDARVWNVWRLWQPATLAGGVALGLGLVGEELLRSRRRIEERATL